MLDPHNNADQIEEGREGGGREREREGGGGDGRRSSGIGKRSKQPRAIPM